MKTPIRIPALMLMLMTSMALCLAVSRARDGKAKDEVWNGFLAKVGEAIAAGAASSAAEIVSPPYPPSPAMARVEFDWSTHRREAEGSDNWPVTWAGDGHQYAAWGDGGGFGGDNKKGRVTLGVARIEGDADSYTGHNVWGGFAPEREATFGGKSYGILSAGGTLYLWVVPQPGPHLKECRLASSLDHGATWTKADWAFRFEDGLSIPAFLNFGRDNDGARDAFIYTGAKGTSRCRPFSGVSPSSGSAPAAPGSRWSSPARTRTTRGTRWRGGSCRALRSEGAGRRSRPSAGNAGPAGRGSRTTPLFTG